MRVIRVIFASACVCSAALAAPPDYWVPVDQAVGDLDRSAVSLRRVEIGLRSDGTQHTNLYMERPEGADWPTASQGPRPPVYFRVGAGFRARVDRMDYLSIIGPPRLKVSPALNPAPLPPIRFSEVQPVALNQAPYKTGAFGEIIPPNTVFLIAAPPPPEPLVPPAQPHRVDARVNARIDARVRGQTPAADQPQSPAAPREGTARNVRIPFAPPQNAEQH